MIFFIKNFSINDDAYSITGFQLPLFYPPQVSTSDKSSADAISKGGFLLFTCPSLGVGSFPLSSALVNSG